MQDKVSFSKKRPFTPLNFFRNLDLGGKIAFSFLGFFFVSLLFGGGYLFWRQEFSKGLLVSFRDYVQKEDSLGEEQSLESLYSNKSIGSGLGESEDNCPQKVLALTVQEKENSRWLVSTENSNKFYLEKPCPNGVENSSLEGGRISVVIENCEGNIFSKCYQLPKENEFPGVYLGRQGNILRIKGSGSAEDFFFPYGKELQRSTLENLGDVTTVTLHFSNSGSIVRVSRLEKGKDETGFGTERGRAAQSALLDVCRFCFWNVTLPSTPVEVLKPGAQSALKEVRQAVLAGANFEATCMQKGRELQSRNSDYYYDFEKRTSYSFNEQNRHLEEGIQEMSPGDLELFPVYDGEYLDDEITENNGLYINCYFLLQKKD